MKSEFENIEEQLNKLVSRGNLNCSDSFTEDLINKINGRKSRKVKINPAVFVVIIIILLNAGSILYMNNYNDSVDFDRKSSLKTVIKAYSLNSYENNLKIHYQFVQPGIVGDDDQK